jgi:hypothetical protein
VPVTSSIANSLGLVWQASGLGAVGKLEQDLLEQRRRDAPGAELSAARDGQGQGVDVGEVQVDAVGLRPGAARLTAGVGVGAGDPDDAENGAGGIRTSWARRTSRLFGSSCTTAAHSSPPSRPTAA